MTAPALAATETWQIDPTHSAVHFAVRHMMFATVRGQFGELAGTITVGGDDLRTAAVDVTIGVASLDTRMAQRDAHLRSADFFDVGVHPTATYVARGARPAGTDQWALDGTLTIKGIAKPVTLTVRPLGAGLDPWGQERRAWTAMVTLDRRDFDLNWNQALEAGGVLVANEVELTLDIQATPAAA